MQMGTTYYDINAKKLVYQLSFPEKEVLLTTDSCTYRIKGDTLSDKNKVPGFIQQSIFHLVLKGDLQNFGLNKSALKIDKVERQNGMVITTWVPEKKNKLFKGKIMVSTKENKLFGVVYLDGKDNLVSKQFYEDYKVVAGLAFPKKVVYIMYKDGKEFYKVLTFRNVKLNEKGSEEFYNCPIPE